MIIWNRNFYKNIQAENSEKANSEIKTKEKKGTQRVDKNSILHFLAEVHLNGILRVKLHDATN